MSWVVLGDPARHLPSNPLAVRRVALQHLHRKARHLTAQRLFQQAPSPRATRPTHVLRWVLFAAADASESV